MAKINKFQQINTLPLSAQNILQAYNIFTVTVITTVMGSNKPLIFATDNAKSSGSGPSRFCDS